MHGSQEDDLIIWQHERYEGSDELYGEIRKLELLERKPRTTLYHYTDGRGLKGIAESRSMRMTSVTHMNDAGELAYAVNLIRNCLDKAESESPHLADLYTHMKLRFNPFQRSFGVYVCCFCERGDLLSQWRTYGLYALGFSTESTIRVERHPFHTIGWEGGIFRKVEYCRARQEEIISFIIQRVSKLCETLAPTAGSRRRGLIQNLSSLFSNLVTEFLIGFKDKAFKEEQEWRLIHIAVHKSESESLKFRVHLDYLVPYIDMPLRSVDEEGAPQQIDGTDVATTGRFPLREIIIGPAAFPGLAKQSLELFLDHLGRNFVQIIASNTSLRRW